jgi:hypothetical protein
MGRAERVITIHHADGLEAREALSQFVGGKRPEPAHAHKADLLALLAHLANGDLDRRGERAHAHEHHVGVVGHIFLEEGVAVGAAEDALEVGVGFLDHIVSAVHGRVVLAADLHDPILVRLRGDGDRIIGMQEEVGAVVTRQELVDLVLGRDIDERLRVGQESAVATDGAGEEDPPVLGHAIGNERGVKGLLTAVHPIQHPAQVADGKRIIVLGAEGAGIVEGAVADHGDHGQAERGSDGERFHRVHPSHAAGTAEDAGADGGSVLDDFKLRVLAFGDDVFAVHFAVGHELADVLHHGVIGSDGISGNHIHIGELAGNGNRLAAGN